MASDAPQARVNRLYMSRTMLSYRLHVQAFSILRAHLGRAIDSLAPKCCLSQLTTCYFNVINDGFPPQDSHLRL